MMVLQLNTSELDSTYAFTCVHIHILNVIHKMNLIFKVRGAFLVRAMRAPNVSANYYTSVYIAPLDYTQL